MEDRGVRTQENSGSGTGGARGKGGKRKFSKGAVLNYWRGKAGKFWGRAAVGLRFFGRPFREG